MFQMSVAVSKLMHVQAPTAPTIFAVHSCAQLLHTIVLTPTLKQTVGLYITLKTFQVRRGAGKKGKTCARVRGYTGRKTLHQARVRRTTIGCSEAWVVLIGRFGGNWSFVFQKSEGVQEAEEGLTQIKEKTAALTTGTSSIQA